MKFRFFVLFCLVAFFLIALPPKTAHSKSLADSSVTDQTEEKQRDPKVALVKEIIDDHKNALKRESAETGVPVSEIVAVIAVESSNNPKAVSKAGARGLMQILPGTERGLKTRCSPKKTTCQIKNGTKFFKQLRNSEYVKAFSKAKGISPTKVAFLAYNEGLEGSKRFKTSKTVLAHNYVRKCVNYLHIAKAVLAAQEI